ncbi:MAG TPA: isoprenylcysteine carboxylmethyltransferase family protein [Bryobacteraceae bacterium]|jgi:protein-S-isoprenylcysteine O-methyltransferase Ste14
MQFYVYLILACAWVIWFAPFVFLANRSSKAQQVNRRARWGIVLQMIAYALLWQGRFWERDVPVWKLSVAVLFFIAASLLSWSSVRALGAHWRVEAALNADHRLVRSGPYALVRHPVYTSMFCILLGTGLLLTPWPLFLVAIMIFLAGAGIRMGVENTLLAARFGDEFIEYKRSVPAMIPGLPKIFLQSR